MKKSKLLIVLLLVALACLSLVACEQHVHTYKWAIDTKSTETAKGSATGTCICGETTSRELPALTDTAFWMVTTAEATHESAGSKTYTNAETALSIVVEIPAGEHTFGKWSIVTKATETTPGSAKRTCSGCNNDETMVLPVLADSTFWTVTTESADHSKVGKNTYTNAATGLSIDVEIPVGAHSYGAWSISADPTATATGTAVRSCTCGAQDSATIAVLGDTSVWTVVHSKDASHTEGGVVVYSSIYGTVTTTSAKIDHSYGAWTITKDPTATATGSAFKTCSCGHSVVEDVPVLSNSIWTMDDSNKPSHEAAGSVVYTSDYGTVTIVVPAGEHVFGSWKDSGDGKHTRSCACGAKETVAHVFDQRVANSTTKKADATCTTGAKYAYSCACGAVGTETFFSGEGTGHELSEFTLTKAPTCTETGLATIKCTKCDYENANSVIAALGHDWSTTYYPYFGSSQYWDEEGNVVVDEDSTSEYHAKVCTVCGVCDEDGKVAHTYGDAYVVATKDNTYTQMTLMHDCECGYAISLESSSNLGYLELAWTKGAEVLATYNNAGSIVYTRGDYTYTLNLPKLVAPYDGKTYHTIAVDSSSTTKITISTSWNTASVTFDANGKGTGNAFPFRGANEVTMGKVTGNVGQITWKIGAKTYNGYVDMTTGIAVVSEDNHRFFIMTCLDDNPSADQIGGATLGTSMAVSYKYNCSIGTHDFNFYIDNSGKVTFGVDFVDVNGSVIRANNIASANYVRIEKDGARLAAFAKNSEGNFVETDGIEGTYTCVAGEDTVTFTVDGMGGISMSTPAGVAIGTYAAVADETYYDAYVTLNSVKSYIQVTFNTTNGTCTFNRPMTAIAYTTAHGTVAESFKSVNTNIEFALPTMEPVTVDGQKYAFAGWYFDASYTRSAGTKITPTEDITLYAKWELAVELTIQDENATTVTKIVPSGSALSEHVPAYEKGVTISTSGKKYFKYWAVEDAESDIDAIIDADLTIVAVWADIPVYAGAYKLYDTGYENGSWTGSKSFVIDYDGNITGDISGTVTSYDETTGKLVWSNGVMYVDATTKFVVAPYSNITPSTITIQEVYVGVIGVTASNSAYYNYGIKNASGNYCARFFKYNDLVAFWYNNAIYSNITIADALGNALSINKSDSNFIANSATLVVKQSDTVIFSAAAVNGKFSGGSNTKSLDAYYGTYTLTDADSITFDGAGNFVWGDKKGTYTLIDADTATFDVYVVASSKNAEHHVVTLDVDGKTYTSTKPMVNVSYVSSVTPNETLTSPASVNKNIEITLPTLTYDDTQAFVGWYTDAAFTTKVATPFKPIADVTLYAKWVEPSPFMGEYVGYKISYGSSSYSKKLTIDALGNVTEDRTGTVDYDSATGKLKIGSYYCAYDAEIGMIVISNSSSTTSFGSDTYFFFRSTSVTTSSSNIVSWNGNKTRLIAFTIDGSATPTYVFLNDSIVVANVTWSAKDKTYAAVESLANVSANAVMISVTAGETTYNYAKNSSNSFVALTDELQGKYTNGEDYIVLNGVGVIYFKDGTSGKYTVAENGTISALTSAANYTITLDTSAKTFTKVDNKVTINYYDGETELTDKQATPYSSIKYTLIAGPEKEGYVFRGWYESATFSGSKVTSVTPTENKTYYAKYDAAVTLTFDYNGYADADEKTSYAIEGKFVDDKVGTLPTVLNDAKLGTKVFVGWYTANGADGNWGDEVTTSTTLTSTTTTYYAKWIEPAAAAGTYKGFNLYNAASGSSKANKDLSTEVLTLKPTGAFTGVRDISGTLSAEDFGKANGAINLTRYAYISDALGGIVILGYSNNATSVGTDYYIGFKKYEKITQVDYSADKFGGIYATWITVSYKDDDNLTQTINLFIYEDVIIANVSWTEGITAKQCAKADSVVMYDKDGNAFIKKSDSAMVGNDGMDGTYTATSGGIGDIVLDGYGSVTIGSATVAYVRDNSNISFVHSNRMYVLTLNKDAHTYTQALDGYQGEYTMPDGTTKINLDGYGAVTGTSKTYVVSGATITIYDGETSAEYGIDTTTKALLGKSIFAGLTFSGRYTDGDNNICSVRIEFADTAAISGTLYSGYDTSYYFDFTAEMDGNTITFTFTRTIDGSTSVGKNLIGILNGNTITFQKHATNNITNNVYTFYNNGSVTCPDFSA